MGSKSQECRMWGLDVEVGCRDHTYLLEPCSMTPGYRKQV